MVLALSVSFCFVPCPSSPFFFCVCTFSQFLPSYPVFLFLLIHACLEVLYSLPHFPVAHLMLSCIFAFPFFPQWRPAVLWVMHSPRGRGLEVAEGTAAKATQEPDLRVAPWQRSLTQAMFSAPSMAS